MLVFFVMSVRSSAEMMGWQVKSLVNLEYPPVAAQARLQGAVEVECILTDQGYVKSSRVLRGNQLLGRAAQENIGKWQFQKVPSMMLGSRSDGIVLHYEFKVSGKTCLKSTCPTVFNFEYPNSVTIEIDAPHWQPTAGK